MARFNTSSRILVLQEEEKKENVRSTMTLASIVHNLAVLEMSDRVGPFMHRKIYDRVIGSFSPIMLSETGGESCRFLDHVNTLGEAEYIWKSYNASRLISAGLPLSTVLYILEFVTGIPSVNPRTLPMIQTMCHQALSFGSYDGLFTNRNHNIIDSPGEVGGNYVFREVKNLTGPGNPFIFNIIALILKELLMPLIDPWNVEERELRCNLVERALGQGLLNQFMRSKVLSVLEELVDVFTLTKPPDHLFNIFSMFTLRKIRFSKTYRDKSKLELEQIIITFINQFAFGDSSPNITRRLARNFTFEEFNDELVFGEKRETDHEIVLGMLSGIIYTLSKTIHNDDFVLRPFQCSRNIDGNVFNYTSFTEGVLRIDESLQAYKRTSKEMDEAIQCETDPQSRCDLLLKRDSCAKLIADLEFQKCTSILNVPCELALFDPTKYIAGIRVSDKTVSSTTLGFGDLYSAPHMKTKTEYLAYITDLHEYREKNHYQCSIANMNYRHYSKEVHEELKRSTNALKRLVKNVEQLKRIAGIE
jgi:hypothetical protein